ncbi:TMV resistance protein N-like [Tripterygium wilfordii]|uniref:TMV resistance protein N-like n=2 Tax=Tripterygium wilfordii TaxID=458696 RepID=A0A7J7CV62_TRIWF|nr:TMV resistance protein N-like [Tripterygium wilfordii]
MSLKYVFMDGCKKISNTLKESILQVCAVNYVGFVYLPGTEIPDWYSYVNEGPSVSFQIPKFVDNELKGFTYCAVYSSILDNMESAGRECYMTIFNYTKCVKKRVGIAFGGVSISEDHLWQGYRSSESLDLDFEDEVEVFLHLGDEFTIKKTGVCLVYEKDVNIEYKSNLITDNEDEVNEDAGEGVTDKRGRDGDGDEAGPSHGWSKRLRYETNVGYEQH